MHVPLNRLVSVRCVDGCDHQDQHWKYGVSGWHARVTPAVAGHMPQSVLAVALIAFGHSFFLIFSAMETSLSEAENEAGYKGVAYLGEADVQVSSPVSLAVRGGMMARAGDQSFLGRRALLRNVPDAYRPAVAKHSATDQAALGALCLAASLPSLSLPRTEPPPAARSSWHLSSWHSRCW